MKQLLRYVLLITCVLLNIIWLSSVKYGGYIAYVGSDRWELTVAMGRIQFWHDVRVRNRDSGFEISHGSSKYKGNYLPALFDRQVSSMASPGFPRD